MTWYVLRRLAQAILVVAGVIVLTFVVARIVPGDPAGSWAGPKASQEELDAVREELGLDAPLPEQIASYFAGVAQGDWGTAVHTRQPVLEDLMDRAPASIELVVVAMIFALLFGIPLGLLSARWNGKLPDSLVRFFSVFAVSMPSFWLALILQLVFFQKLRWFPVAGQYDPNLDYTHPLVQYTRMPIVDALITGNWWVFRSALWHIVLPAIVVAAYPFGVVTRMVRASVLDTLGEDHVRMIRALGFSERSVFGKWALKPAWNPVMAVLALVFAYSLANSFLVESIFNWPGLGAYAAASIASLDTPAIVGVTLFIAIVYVIGNLVVDIVQAALDPRIELT